MIMLYVIFIENAATINHHFSIERSKVLHKTERSKVFHKTERSKVFHKTRMLLMDKKLISLHQIKLMMFFMDRTSVEDST